MPQREKKTKRKVLQAVWTVFVVMIALSMVLSFTPGLFVQP